MRAYPHQDYSVEKRVSLSVFCLHLSNQIMPDNYPDRFQHFHFCHVHHSWREEGMRTTRCQTDKNKKTAIIAMKRNHTQCSHFLVMVCSFLWIKKREGLPILYGDTSSLQTFRHTLCSTILCSFSSNFLLKDFSCFRLSSCSTESNPRLFFYATINTLTFCISFLLYWVLNRRLFRFSCKSLFCFTSLLLFSSFCDNRQEDLLMNAMNERKARRC